MFKSTKRSIWGALLLLFLTRNAFGLTASQCRSVLTPIGLLGDFELLVDPVDPDQNLILTATQGENPAGNAAVSVVVARISGITGDALSDQIVIARNFTGTNIQGPEFSYSPELGLGILYHGPGGVHATWRRDGAWHHFKYDVFGSRHYGIPPPLPGTLPGLDPRGGMPLGNRTLFEVSYLNGGSWMGSLGEIARTDLIGAISDFGITVTDRMQLTGSPLDPDAVIFSGCDRFKPECAIFEARMDGGGGLKELTQLSEASTMPLLWIIAALHPVTHYLIVIGGAGPSLVVLESDGTRQPLTEIARLPAGTRNATHPRVVASQDALFLHFIERGNAGRGSYVMRYGGIPGIPEWISPHGSGSELVYLPKTNRLSLFYKTRNDLTRCWVD